MSQNQSFWTKAQNVDRRILYLILIVFVSAGLFVKVIIPAQPDDSSVSFYRAIQDLDPDKPVLLQSDWTNSTRGENLGHLEASLRILMSQERKFALYSLADPQAPQVARDVVRRINDEMEANGKRRYELGTDYVELGYFPNAEGTLQSMASDLKKAWSGRKTKVADGSEVDIFRTDVLSGVTKVEDTSAILVVTASSTVDFVIQRMSGKLPILCQCTGVMGPQVLPFYQAGQVAGVPIGLKGVYDVELMMTSGVNAAGEDGKVAIQAPGTEVAPLDYAVTFGRGQQYYAALHVALFLMILAVILGNIGLAITNRGGKR